MHLRLNIGDLTEAYRKGDVYAGMLVAIALCELEDSLANRSPEEWMKQYGLVGALALNKFTK